MAPSPLNCGQPLRNSPRGEMDVRAVVGQDPITSGPITSGSTWPTSAAGSGPPKGRALRARTAGTGRQPGDPDQRGTPTPMVCAASRVDHEVRSCAGRNDVGTWLAEGRVAAEVLVWREGWPQWRVAASVFPHLAQTVPAVPGAATVAEPQPNVSAQAAAGAVPAMVLAVDEPLPATKRVTSRRPTARRAREQRSLMIGLLVTLVVVLLPILIYVLLNQ